MAYAFPTTAGDSYTASIVMVDEADLIKDLDFLMNAVKPTIDAGGRMVLLSRSNKDEPNSTFKRMYVAAKAGTSGWNSVFLPWNVRPSRDEQWYEEQRMDVVARTGSLDDLHQQYPATDAEALSPRSQAKRIPAAWLRQCLEEEPGIEDHGGPAIVGLIVYRQPIDGEEYVIGADPAEGNPTSDESSMHLLHRGTGEEVAKLKGLFQPDVFAGFLGQVSAYYNNAPALVERNNHGHVVISWLRDNAKHGALLKGQDGRYGWQTNTKSKADMYTTTAEAFRDGMTRLHSFETYVQLTSIEGATLKAPKNELDDDATSYALALQGLYMPAPVQFTYSYLDTP